MASVVNKAYTVATVASVVNETYETAVVASVVDMADGGSVKVKSDSNPNKSRMVFKKII